MQKINNGSTAFQGSINFVTYKKAGEKVIKRTKKYTTTEIQDSLIKSTADSMCENNLRRHRLTKKDSNLFNALIEKITGRKLPSMPEKTRYMTNLDDEFVAYGDRMPKETGGMSVTANIKKPI